MTKKKGDLAKSKLEMLEIYSQNPEISNAEMAVKVRLDPHTVAKYKGQLRDQINTLLVTLNRKLSEKIADSV